MSGSLWTDEQKLEAIEREVKMRRRVYPRWVADGRMTKRKADEELAIMQAIAEDYRAKAEGARLL